MEEKNHKNLTFFGSFGERLRKLRKDKKLSQKDLAEKLGYKRSASVSYIENNRTPPDNEVLAKIAEVLNADLHWLITGKVSLATKELELKAATRLAPYIEAVLADLFKQLKHQQAVHDELIKDLTSAKPGTCKKLDDVEENMAKIVKTIENTTDDLKWMNQCFQRQRPKEKKT